MNIKFTLKSLLIVLMSLGCFLGAEAQSNTGTIRGVVYREGKVKANVPVILLNEFSDSIAMVVSAINGEYSFNNITPGQYMLRVNQVADEMKGYLGMEGDLFDLSVEGKKLDIVLTQYKIQDLEGGQKKVGVKKKKLPSRRQGLLPPLPIKNLKRPVSETVPAWRVTLQVPPPHVMVLSEGDQEQTVLPYTWTV